MTKADTLVSGAHPYKLSAEIMFIGTDLLVVVSGGDAPHIGSVAVALPRVSLRDRGVMSATSSVYNIPGHKDQVLAQRVSEVLASRLNRTVVAVAGFHKDGISERGIKKVMENAERLAEKTCASLKKMKL